MSDWPSARPAGESLLPPSRKLDSSIAHPDATALQSTCTPASLSRLKARSSVSTAQREWCSAWREARRGGEVQRKGGVARGARRVSGEGRRRGECAMAWMSGSRCESRSEQFARQTSRCASGSCLSPRSAASRAGGSLSSPSSSSPARGTAAAAVGERAGRGEGRGEGRGRGAGRGAGRRVVARPSLIRRRALQALAAEEAAWRGRSRRRWAWGGGRRRRESRSEGASPPPPPPPASPSPPAPPPASGASPPRCSA